ncbi:LapA family protein [Sansalvadorimonas verongulae]|nr:LapA family protein [Sansalvadorimonas verongulae]
MLIRLQKFLRFLGYLLASGFFLVVFAGLMLANNESLVIGFWNWTTPPLSVSFILFLAFFLGCALGVVLSIFYIFRLTLKNQSLQRKLKRRDAELQKLRVNSLRGLSS